MWDKITADSTVNTFQNVSVYLYSGDMTWGKCEWDNITFENTVNIFQNLYVYILEKY